MQCVRGLETTHSRGVGLQPLSLHPHPRVPVSPSPIAQIKKVAAEVGAAEDSIYYMLVSLDDIRAFPYFDLVQTIRSKQEWLGQAEWLGASLAVLYCFACGVYTPSAVGLFQMAARCMIVGALTLPSNPTQCTIVIRPLCIPGSLTSCRVCGFSTPCRALTSGQHGFVQPHGHVQAHMDPQRRPTEPFQDRLLPLD